MLAGAIAVILWLLENGNVVKKHNLCLCQLCPVIDYQFKGHNRQHSGQMSQNIQK